jgi:hypothetical protein
LKERFIIFGGRGNRRERIFADEKDCRRFLALLGESLGRYEVEVHAYVLFAQPFSSSGSDPQAKPESLDALANSCLQHFL